MEAAFFDLDKTVIARASVAAFGRPLYREGLISRSTVARALVTQFVYLHLGASEDRLDRIRESVLSLARGWDRDEVSRIVRQTLDDVIEPIIFAEALELIERHRAAGRRVYLISASPAEIVDPLAEYLGADGAVSSRAVVDADNRYTGGMAFYCYGPYKAEAMRDLAMTERIDLAASYAYSDSYTDLPMLEVVGHPVAVNPDRVLGRLARERGWPVAQFVHPVRLRDRMPVPNLSTAAVVAGTLVAASGTVMALRRHSHRSRAVAAVGLASGLVARRLG